MTVFQDLIEGRIDFEGQRKVEQIAKVWITAMTVISFILGFVLQSMKITFGAFGISAVLLCLVTLPQWPVFNQHSVVWLPVKEKKKQSKGKSQ